MKGKLRFVVAVWAGMASSAFAGPVVDPTASIESTPLGGGEFDYKITLTNSSGSPASIGTFWYGWVPGKDFLDVSPLSVTSPAGWTSAVTNTGANDGFAIQWVGSPTSTLAAGQSLTFEFSSTETPSQLMGNSSFFPSFPQATSFVYSGAPFSDAGTPLVVTADSSPSVVPEPSSLLLSLFGGLAMIAQGRFGRRNRV